MGLFFFILTLIFYGLCHWAASRTPVGTSFPIHQDIPMPVDPSEAPTKICQWIDQHKHFRLVSKDQGQIVAEHKARLLRFGSFYVFRWSKNEKGSLISVSIQPKLVSYTSEKWNLEKHFGILIDSSNQKTS